MNHLWSPHLREVWIWVNTVFIPISLKPEISRSVRGPKLQESRAEDSLTEPYLVQNILVIWLQQITKFSTKIVNLETIIDIQSWCRTYPPNGSNHIRAKQKLLRKHKGAWKSSWSRTGSLKSFTLSIPWNSSKPVKIFPEFIKRFPGIIVRRNIAQIGNKWDCWKSSTQSERRHLRSIIAIRSGWKLVDRFNEILYLSAKHSRSSVRWGEKKKTPYERRLGESFKGSMISFWAMIEYYPMTAKDQSRIHHFGKKVLPGLFLGYALYARWI